MWQVILQTGNLRYTVAIFFWGYKDCKGIYIMSSEKKNTDIKGSVLNNVN